MALLRRRKKLDESGVDISPLIDVVFILLIFFMVSTTFIKDAQVALERPSAQSAAPVSSKALRVTISRDGGLFLQGEAVTPWMLQSRVRDQLRTATDKMVLVVADKGVDVERLVEVVDQCRLAGATQVGLATHKEAG